MKIKRRIKVWLVLLMFLVLPGRDIRAQSLETVRELARIHYIRARNYYRKGAYLQAKQALEKVLELQPEHQGARWYLDFVQRELSRDKKISRRDLRKSEKKELKTVLDSFEEAKLLKENERLEIEVKKYQQAVEKQKQRMKQMQREAKEKEAGRLREEQKRRAEEEKRLRRKRREEQKLAQLKAEKEEQERLKREAEEKRRQEKARQEEEQRLRREKERQAREEKRLKAEQERQRKQEARLAEKKRRAEQKAVARAQKELRLAKLEAEKEKAIEEKRLMQERKEKQEELERTRKQKELEKKIELHYVRGKRHFQNRDYIAARKEFKDILILDPANQYALNALERVEDTIVREERLYQRRKQEQEEAEKKERQEAINEHLGRGRLYFYQERYQEAIEEFGRVLSIDPDNLLARNEILRCKKNLAARSQSKEDYSVREKRAKQEALQRARKKLINR